MDTGKILDALTLVLTNAPTGIKNQQIKVSCIFFLYDDFLYCVFLQYRKMP